MPEELQPTPLWRFVIHQPGQSLGFQGSGLLIQNPNGTLTLQFIEADSFEILAQPVPEALPEQIDSDLLAAFNDDGEPEDPDSFTDASVMTVILLDKQRLECVRALNHWAPGSDMYGQILDHAERLTDLIDHIAHEAL